MGGNLLDFNRSLNLIPKRAEQRQSERLRETFVDSGVAAALEATDHQVVYGRRGTGKTHALRYLEAELAAQGDLAIYLDLRTIGSARDLFSQESGDITQRTTRFISDMLAVFHDAVVGYVLDSSMIDDSRVVRGLDLLEKSLTNFVVEGAVRLETQEMTSQSRESAAGGRLAQSPSFELRAGANQSVSLSGTTETQGTTRQRFNFSEVTAALRDLEDSLQGRRIWLLLDEWSSLPTELQPFLGEFLVRSVLPLRSFTVKIAAIEQQSNFRTFLASGDSVGLELGADMAANLDLDDFMVFEQNEQHARTFFLGLFFKHLTLGSDDDLKVGGLTRERDVIRLGFTDARAFDELVRAAEGVPRDAINIAAKAALRARDRVISVNDVRFAARSWYQTDKEAALKGHPSAPDLLNWVIDTVIGHRRARGFLVNQVDAENELLGRLYDSRVLHVVRRGYSAQDAPGERYDVWVIDYGAYVDLLQTKSQPQGLLPLAGADGADEYTNLEVPVQDLRSIRRAILRLADFEAARTPEVRHRSEGAESPEAFL
ncbi:hypothetical protein [Jannaschia sp. R86511]|uniref:ORC-CDC6 family AAA ATPase n=1 Tax=Jannaschia sp. R86511 TaxID=3093853 RepID=UPI0036D3C8EC